MNDEELYNRLSARSGEPPPNYDVEAGIHYGVLPINSVNNDSMEDVYQNGTDLGYESGREEFQRSCEGLAEELDSAVSLTRDQARAIAKRYTQDWLDEESLDFFVDNWMASDSMSYNEVLAELEDNWSEAMSDSMQESGPYLYESDGYVIKTDSDNIDLFVIKSPYYTLASQCSPCAPNAGYIKSPGSLKSYCLGPEWFDGEYAKLPYDVYSVETGELVDKAKEKQ